jgi:hypothetical protein
MHIFRYFLAFIGLVACLISVAHAQSRAEAAPTSPGVHVRVSGEVAIPGVYWLPQAPTLRQVLRQAGGFLPSAHPFGTQLRRPREAQRQQEDLDSWSDHLALYSQAKDGRNLRHSPYDHETTMQRFRAQHEFIVRLSRARAGGRVLLEIDPDAAAVEQLPELPLEDGDSLHVPARAAEIRVIGEDGSDGGFALTGPVRTADLLDQLEAPVADWHQQAVFVLFASGRVIKFVPGKPSTDLVRPGDVIVLGADLGKMVLDPKMRTWSELLYPRALQFTDAAIVRSGSKATQ